METEQPVHVEITKNILELWESLSTAIVNSRENGLVEDNDWNNIQGKMSDIKWIRDGEESGAIQGIESDATEWRGMMKKTSYGGYVSILEMNLWQHGTKKEIRAFMFVSGLELLSGSITTTIHANSDEMGYKEWEYSLNK